jgi:glycosyltransferase involved in cell wall biosynthesis
MLPSLTVAICTWNRSRSLRATLESLRALDVPAGLDWEVIVVNNNCTDDTDDVLASFASSLPLRRLHEPKQGQSNARNLAIAEARGDYILWTDDDVVVDRQWIRAYLDAFATWPDAVLLGGPIQVEFEGCPPYWLLELIQDERFSAVYAHRDLGREPIRFDAARYVVPYGANMVTRGREQRGLRFDPNLGRSLDGQVRGEELDVVMKLLIDGHEGRWIPEAKVFHVIPPELQTQRHLRRYFAGAGRTFVRQQSTRRRFQAARALVSAAAAELRFRAKRVVLPPRLAFRELRVASFQFGKFLESLR